MKIQGVLDTDPPHHGHGEVGGLEHVDDEEVEHQPADTVGVGLQESRSQVILP